MARSIGLNQKGKWENDFLSLKDGNKLRWSLFQKENAKIEKYIIYLNGRTEWIEKYAFLPLELDFSSNTAFLTFDHRGQGASDGKRGFIDSYDTYADDLQALISKVVGDLPYTILTHSMGGLIALVAASQKKIKPQGMILTAPLIYLPDKPLSKNIAKPLSSVLSGIGLKNFKIKSSSEEEEALEKSPLTHWPYAIKQMKETPYPINFVTPAWINATFKASDQIFTPSAVKALDMPIYILRPEKEYVVDVKGINALQRYFKSLEKSLEVIDIKEAKHEILYERFDIRQKAISKINQILKSWNYS